MGLLPMSLGWCVVSLFPRPLPFTPMHSPVPNVVILLLVSWKDTGLSPSTTTSPGLPTDALLCGCLSEPARDMGTVVGTV